MVLAVLSFALYAAPHLLLIEKLEAAWKCGDMHGETCSRRVLTVERLNAMTEREINWYYAIEGFIFLFGGLFCMVLLLANIIMVPWSFAVGIVTLMFSAGIPMWIIAFTSALLFPAFGLISTLLLFLTLPTLGFFGGFMLQTQDRIRFERVPAR